LLAVKRAGAPQSNDGVLKKKQRNYQINQGKRGSPGLHGIGILVEHTLAELAFQTEAEKPGRFVLSIK